MIDSEERETHIIYDHPAKQVKVFTTQKNIFEHFIKRLGKNNILHQSKDDKKSLYELTLNEELMRKPYLIAPIIRRKNVSK